MTDHECEWEVLKPEQSEPEWYIWCPKCGDRMDTIEEINAIFNEHAKLKRANNVRKRYGRSPTHLTGCKFRGFEGPKDGPVVEIGKCTCGLNALAETNQAG